MDVGCSLKGSTAPTLNHSIVAPSNIYIAHNFNRFSSQTWGYACVSNHVTVHPYAHPPQEKVLKHLKLVYKMDVGCSLKGSSVSTIV